MDQEENIKLYSIAYQKEILFSSAFFGKSRSTGNRLVYLFVGHGKKIGKLPCP
jgi:hypothetical protein